MPKETLFRMLGELRSTDLIRRNYPVLCPVNERRRSFLLQFAMPDLKVGFEVEDVENIIKQRQCFDGNAYHFRMQAFQDAGWLVSVFSPIDIQDRRESVVFYIRHALGLGPKPNLLESNCLPRLTPLTSEEAL